jgi:hypothetical protein
MGIAEYKSGTDTILIEVVGDTTEVRTFGEKRAKGKHDSVLDAGSFDAAIDSVKAVGSSFAKTINEILIKPDTAEVTLSLKFVAGAGVVIAQTSAEAQIGLKLTWKLGKDGKTQD